MRTNGARENKFRMPFRPEINEIDHILARSRHCCL